MYVQAMVVDVLINATPLKDEHGNVYGVLGIAQVCIYIYQKIDRCMHACIQRCILTYIHTYTHTHRFVHAYQADKMFSVSADVISHVDA